MFTTKIFSNLQFFDLEIPIVADHVFPWAARIAFVNLERPVNRQPGFRARDSFVASPRDLRKIISKHPQTLLEAF